MRPFTSLFARSHVARSINSTPLSSMFTQRNEAIQHYYDSIKDVSPHHTLSINGLTFMNYMTRDHTNKGTIHLERLGKAIMTIDPALVPEKAKADFDVLLADPERDTKKAFGHLHYNFVGLTAEEQNELHDYERALMTGVIGENDWYTYLFLYFARAYNRLLGNEELKL